MVVNVFISRYILPSMRVLLSVSDRTGIEDFSRNILDIGGEIYATSGTRNFLISKGIDVRPVEELTNFPEILGGRVKTLHPAVFGGILARNSWVKLKNLE